MPAYDEARARPQARLNKSGWRVLTVGSMLVTCSVVAALVAQTNLSSDQSKPGADGLTTLALVLAVLAFLVQIVVFMYQSVENAQTVGRAEDLHLRTQKALEAIKTQSDATQQVLTSQFTRVLDHALTGRGGELRRGHDDPGERPGDDEQDGESLDTPTDPLEARLADYRAIAQPDTSPSGEDQAVRRYMVTWPDEARAREIVQDLVKLSPLALSNLIRLANAELRQRSEGRRVGGQITEDVAELPWVRELMDAGYVTTFGRRGKLSDRGLDAVRILPYGRTGPRPKPPAWVNAVLAPLCEPIDGGASSRS